MVRRPTILLVEANVSERVVMAQALERARYRVVGAADADEGWRKTVYEQPECIIIDAILPGRSGFELCRQIRAWDPDHILAIILLGARERSLDRTWSLRQGADCYLPRPFSEILLLQAISAMMYSDAQAPAPPQQEGREEMHPAGQEPFSAWRQLVPHRREDPNLLKAVNPFSGAQVIADKQARRLYGAIDGRKNLRELSLALNLEQKELIKALRILFAQQRIQLVTADGQLADGAWLFDQGSAERG